MAFRNRRSGAAYKKLAKEKAIKTAEVLSKVPKLDTFFVSRTVNKLPSMNLKCIV